MMKRKYLFSMFILLMLLVVACDSSESDSSSADARDTFTYESETGPVEVPTNPERIVALTNAPNVHALGGSLVGVDEWTMKNPLFKESLEAVEVVSESDPESILAQDPDLIIAGSHMENLEELEK